MAWQPTVTALIEIGENFVTTFVLPQNIYLKLNRTYNAAVLIYSGE